MENTTYIYTDGSYLDESNKCGYCFLYFQHGLENELTFVFGKCNAVASTESELIAIIKALEYFKNLSGQKENTKYVIGIDELNIFKFITKKIYREFEINGWNYSDGKPRKKNAKLWRRLLDLYMMFPEGTLKLKKVESKKDKYNRQSDRIARFILNKELEDEECSYIVNNVGDYKSIISYEINPSKIIINEFGVTLGKEIQLNVNKKIDWDSLSNDSNIQCLAVDDIYLTEELHLKCQSINFNGILYKMRKGTLDIKPIAVRKIDNSNKYYLVAGIIRYFSCKILGINTIYVIETSLDNKGFLKKYGIW